MEIKRRERERGWGGGVWPAGDTATAGANCVALSAIFLQVSLFLFLLVVFFHPSLNLGFTRGSRNALNPQSAVCDFLDISMQPVIQLKHNML